MKTIKYLLGALLMSLATMANAQSTSNNLSIDFKAGANTSEYKRYYASFASMVITTDMALSEDKEKARGINFGLVKGKNISNGKLPLFLEYGLEATWVRYHDEDTEENEDWYYSKIVTKDELSINMVSLAIPLNVVYSISLMNGEYEVAPYAGLNVKVNVIGIAKDKSSETRYDGDRVVDEESGTEKAHFFTKDDTDDSPANRFQLGMNLGFNIYKGKYSL